jgi:uncharacterized membrane protein YkgB
VQNKIIILLSFALAAAALFRRSKRTQRPWFQHLQGWQKLCGVIAIVLALLILLNPEFLALGILGDTAFFDLLVLALSVQMLTSVRWAWQWLRTCVLRSAGWLGIPSPGLRYLMCASAIAFTSVISAVQKVIHKISS